LQGIASLNVRYDKYLFGPVTPEFKGVKCIHSSSISSLAMFSLLLDFAGISTEFYGAITTQYIR